MVYENLRADQLIDAMQTAALIVTAGAQIYTMLLLRNEMGSAARALKTVLDGHDEVMRNLNRMWTRIYEIEVKLGIYRSSPGDDSSV